MYFTYSTCGSIGTVHYQLGDITKNGFSIINRGNTSQKMANRYKPCKHGDQNHTSSSLNYYSNMRGDDRNYNYSVNTNGRSNTFLGSNEKRKRTIKYCNILTFTIFISLVLWGLNGKVDTLDHFNLKEKGKSSYRQREGEEVCGSGKEYFLERHEFDSSHGDVCRHVMSGNFICPKNCQATLNYVAPYCISSSQKTSHPCRIPRTNKFDLVYNCNIQGGERGVCMNYEESSGFASQNGKFHNYKSCQEACQKKIGTKLEHIDLSWLWTRSASKKFFCRNDWDCSLAGICIKNNGQCQCDAWATGKDCSYLKFQPVDKSKLGYGFQTPHSSWGGSVTYHDSVWHMYVSEIICDENDVRNTRCGLSKWQTNSQVVHATATHVDGPYQRQEVVLSTEHHNPTLQVVSVSKMNTIWYLYSISNYDGPIEVIASTDFGNSWTDPKIISKHQNPGPIIHENGTMTMYYRGDNGQSSVGPCSKEYIGRQVCTSPTGPCQNPHRNDKNKGKSIFSHTAEDPMVFRDTRGNYHMLVNALPYKCSPKFHQGGHAWSRDGINWSEPRLGAFNTTILFQDGSTMTCERRERPQMILHPQTKKPLALVSALVGCPRKKIAHLSSSSTPFTFRGNDDSFTLVQLMQQ